MKKLILYGLVVGNLTVFCGRAENRAFAVRDDIAMVRFDDPSALANGVTAKFSPDGQYFAIVSSRGLLESDQIKSALSIYSTSDSRAYLMATSSAREPKPRSTITIAAAIHSQRSSAYNAVITDLRWASDSSGLYFIAEEVDGYQRLYRMNIQSRKPTPLSPTGFNVARYDFANGRVVYSAWRSTRSIAAGSEQDDGDKINRDAREVTGESLEKILFPNSQPVPVDQELWLVRRNHGHPVPARVPCAPEREMSWLPEAFSLSPRGHMIAQLRPVKQMKSAWIHYEPEQGDEFLRLTSKDPGAVAANNTWRLKEYSLVNLDSGKITALIDAPQSYSLGYSSQSQATWSPDERSVLLINTFLSLDRVGEADQFRRLRPCAIADVRLPSMDSHCVVFMSDLAAQGAKIVTESLSFGRDDDEVTFAVRLNQGGEELQRYSWTKSGWQRGTIYASTQEGNQAEERRGPNSNELTVTVKQGLNEPPTLWVTNVRTGQSKMLWDPNPQLVHLQFGKASVYHWKDRSGHEWTGGLVMPAGYVVGKRYPLVLQIYNFDESQFLTDGMMPTAFAARALASSGVAVLQIQRRLPHTFDMAEADAQLAGLESAIDQLSAEGIAAPQRVGLVGFSFSCWYVENALIKAPTRFMAATIADGLDVSYMQYHLWGIDSRSLEREFDAVIGSKPFGKGLSQWLEQAPGFHLDLVQTPLRIEAIGPMSILGEWEIYSSLKMQGKPVDLIYFPTGQHIHQNPLERLESQEGDVDWFRFWLQGYADPAPSKRDQYERWEKLRDGITSSKTITGQ